MEGKEINEISMEQIKSQELKKSILSYLGLSQRGRNAVSGEFSVESAIKAYSACLVIVADDASAHTKKMFTNMCSFYEVPLYFIATKEEIGHAMGYEYRASAAITDEGLANAAIKKLELLKKLTCK